VNLKSGEFSKSGTMRNFPLRIGPGLRFLRREIKSGLIHAWEAKVLLRLLGTGSEKKGGFLG